MRLVLASSVYFCGANLGVREGPALLQCVFISLRNAIQTLIASRIQDPHLYLHLATLGISFEPAKKTQTSS